METIKIKLYSFNELKEDIKDKVIQDNYDINVNYDWWDSTHYIFQEYGIKIKSFDLYRGHIDIQNILDWEEIAQNLKNNISDDNYFNKLVKAGCNIIDLQNIFNMLMAKQWHYFFLMDMLEHRKEAAHG